MISMTESARDFLALVLADLTGSGESDCCLRLMRSHDGGIALEMDTQTDEDLAFVHVGRTILVINRDLAEDYQGRRIDISAGAGQQPALVIV